MSKVSTSLKRSEVRHRGAASDWENQRSNPERSDISGSVTQTKCLTGCSEACAVFEIIRLHTPWITYTVECPYNHPQECRFTEIIGRAHRLRRALACTTFDLMFVLWKFCSDLRFSIF